MTDAPVRLRPFEDADVTDRYLAWFRDPEVTRYLESSNLTRDDVLAFARQGRGEWRFQYAVVERGTDLHVGNVKIDVARRHAVGETSIVLGERAAWGKGYATWAIRLLTRLAFEELGLRKLSAGIYSVNLGSLKCFTRAGWRLDAVQHDHLLHEGRPVDRIVMAAFNPALSPPRDEAAERRIREIQAAIEAQAAAGQTTRT